MQFLLSVNNVDDSGGLISKLKSQEECWQSTDLRGER